MIAVLGKHSPFRTFPKADHRIFPYRSLVRVIKLTFMMHSNPSEVSPVLAVYSVFAVWSKTVDSASMNDFLVKTFQTAASHTLCFLTF
jgi:hypothetical protein